MGCCSSRESDINLQDLAPVPGQDGPPISTVNLTSCLEQVASYFHEKGRHVRYVCVGGVINTLHLSSRDATRDVDLITSESNRADEVLLAQASRHVKIQNPTIALDENWINSNARLFIPHEMLEAIIQEAFAQNDIILDAPGLTLYAAPYSYSIVAKLNRFAGGGGPEHDLEDIVA